METYIKKIEEKLMSYVPESDCLENDVIKSMRYSLSAGGKRIRPLLALYFCELCGGKAEEALPFACAVEMVHTYSLIHDDLPCMDDDNMRRGKPSNHIVFGEDTALLAGDALLTLAFEVISCKETRDLVGDSRCIEAANTLSRRIGAHGMVGGQVIDLKYENKNAGIEILREMDDKKTGDLIACACELGCIAASASEQMIKQAARYGKALGLAFQIMDDILDVTADEKQFGKPVHSDSNNNKSTYISLYGIDKCRELVKTLTNEAIDCLKDFNACDDKLVRLSLDLCNRQK